MAVSQRDKALAGGAPRIGVFVRLGLPTPVRLWLGIGDCKAGIDAEDGVGAIYKGLGQLLNVPAFQQLLNGMAERVEFRLSGVTQDIMSMASTEAADVKGIPLLVGVGLFGNDWQLLADPTWLKRLTVDYLSVEQEGSREGVVRSVKLSTRSFLTGRRRPGLSYFTDAEQQSRSPGDRFCERTGLYSTEVQKTWPRF